MKHDRVERGTDKIVQFAKRFPILFFVFLIVFLFLLAFFVPFSRTDISFNQNYIERTSSEFNALTLSDRLQSIYSNFTARINNIPNNNKTFNLDTQNPDSFFEFVFPSIPYYAIVRPTEMYYYFTIPEYEIWGNLNFKEAGTGKISFAYFAGDNPQNYNQKTFTDADGLLIKTGTNNTVQLTFKGKTVTFKLPETETAAPKDLQLLSDEEYVSKIQDESGVRFHLVFNKKTKSFYYIIDNELPLPESTIALGEKMLIGNRTHFIYFKDSDRSRNILIGVDSNNILKNNYFDGPFDQVPPNLELRDQLYAAYPYTQYLNGLDPHGNFIDWKDSRVAVSPYSNYYYPNTDLLTNTLNSCNKQRGDPSLFFSCLTYESKKDFHKTIPEFFHPDGRKK